MLTILEKVISFILINYVSFQKEIHEFIAFIKKKKKEKQEKMNFKFNIYKLSLWISISHYFFVRKNPKGLGDVPQQAGVATTLVASKASACQTT